MKLKISILARIKTSISLKEFNLDKAKSHAKIVLLYTYTYMYI